MGSSKIVKRFIKKDFGPRKMQLPKSLDFLSSINFYAIVEEKSLGRTVRTVEVKPTTLRRLIEQRDFLDEYLAEIVDVVKALKSDNRKLRSGNKLLVENKKRADELSLELESAQKKIEYLSSPILPSTKLSKDNVSLQEEIKFLKQKVENCKVEINILAQDRNKLIVLEQENEVLHDKVERLEKVNEKLMENIEATREDNIPRANNIFFGRDSNSKRYNAKPYSGGRSR